jgi:prepilin-type N-terminal cleavage/methylation domain-containing protein
MLRKLTKDNRGFTIIEVLIVLAIAGLIMLIVFLAVPALQRNSRNNARNSDASRIAAAVTECMANRNGVTGSCDTLTYDTTNNTSASTSELQTGSLTQIQNANTTVAADTQNARITFNTQCNATGTATGGTSGGARSFAITYRLEPAVDRCIAS